MIANDRTLLSDDVKSVCFCCDLESCKGACCIEGDAGAPLEEGEIGIIEDSLEEIKPYMTPEGIEVVESLGVFDYDMTGQYVTPLIRDSACAFISYENDIAICAIEKAYNEGKISFIKPISCHLYPIRLIHYNDFDAANYHQWHVCKPALIKGKELNLPIYKFLKTALIRKYGVEWYNNLTSMIEVST